MNNVEVAASVGSGVSLEQARALVALAQHGTFTGAAQVLRRGHSSVLYLMRTLEDVLGVAVLDRSGYRTALTPAGQRVLQACQLLVAADAALANAVTELRSGWEAQVHVVCDGIVPIAPLLTAVGALLAERVPTRIDVRAEFLAGVEEAFWQNDADLMIAVLPPSRAGLVGVALPPVDASLVVRGDHPLAHGFVSEAALREHVLLTVRGSDPRLLLPTAGIEAHATVRLNDFAAKHTAILAGVGYGWLPDGMIAADLGHGRLRRVQWAGAATHRFTPHLYHRGPLGRAGQRLLDALLAAAQVAARSRPVGAMPRRGRGRTATSAGGVPRRQKAQR